jgi:hypothetical protein
MNSFYLSISASCIVSQDIAVSGSDVILSTSMNQMDQNQANKYGNSDDDQKVKEQYYIELIEKGNPLPKFIPSQDLEVMKIEAADGVVGIAIGNLRIYGNRRRDVVTKILVEQANFAEKPTPKFDGLLAANKENMANSVLVNLDKPFQDGAVANIQEKGLVDIRQGGDYHIEDWTPIGDGPLDELFLFGQNGFVPAVYINCGAGDGRTGNAFAAVVLGAISRQPLFRDVEKSKICIPKYSLSALPRLFIRVCLNDFSGYSDNGYLENTTTMLPSDDQYKMCHEKLKSAFDENSGQLTSDEMTLLKDKTFHKLKDGTENEYAKFNFDDFDEINVDDFKKWVNEKSRKGFGNYFDVPCSTAVFKALEISRRRNPHYIELSSQLQSLQNLHERMLQGQRKEFQEGSPEIVIETKHAQITGGESPNSIGNKSTEVSPQDVSTGSGSFLTKDRFTSFDSKSAKSHIEEDIVDQTANLYPSKMKGSVSLDNSQFHTAVLKEFSIADESQPASATESQLNVTSEGNFFA